MLRYKVASALTAAALALGIVVGTAPAASAYGAHKAYYGHGYLNGWWYTQQFLYELPGSTTARHYHEVRVCEKSTGQCHRHQYREYGSE